MDDRKKIFDIINGYFKDTLYNKKISDLRKNEEKLLFAKDDSIYNHYTVEDFLMLEKINRLEEKNIISNYVAKNLRKIYELKIQLKKIFESLMYRQLNNLENMDNKKQLEEIKKRIDEINNILENYHLIITNNNSIIDLLINDDNYEIEKDDTNLEAIVKKLNLSIK